MRCKFFMWLVVHKKCLIADNLARRGWPHSPTCALCLTEPECCSHLFVHRRFTQQIWHKLRLWAKASFPIPSRIFHNTEDWWIAARRRAPKPLRRDFDTFVILVHRRIWKERNARVFQQVSNPVGKVFDLIIEDLLSWRTAGCIEAF